MIHKELVERYPWLSITTTVEEYVSPEYYGELLKDYVFGGKTDLEFFSTFLSRLTPSKDLEILELGCGSGRATNVLFDWLGEKSAPFHLVDLSNQMLDFSKNRFSNRQGGAYVQSDSVKFMEETDEKYDLAFSLWSFSHSVHQILTEKGPGKGTEYIQSVLNKFFRENMKSGSSFFLIHFDSLSDEQRILIQQWKKVFPTFEQNDVQSPSKLLIDEELAALEKEGAVLVDAQHHIGEEIVYTSEDEALEIFLNFHMESYFNESEILPEMIEELKTYFQQYTDSEGRVKIKPGCFIYQVNRL